MGKLATSKTTNLLSSLLPDHKLVKTSAYLLRSRKILPEIRPAPAPVFRALPEPSTGARIRTVVISNLNKFDPRPHHDPISTGGAAAARWLPNLRRVPLRARILDFPLVTEESRYAIATSDELAAERGRIEWGEIETGAR